MLAVSCAWVRLGQPEGLTSTSREQAFGIHGGDYETSLMLAFRPDLVKAEEIRDFPVPGRDIRADFARLRVTQPVGFGWMSQDINPDGVVGEAHLATTEKGRRIADHVAGEFIRLLQDVSRFDLAGLQDGPLSS